MLLWEKCQKKWKKMTDNDRKWHNETVDWNIIGRTKWTSQALLMVKNDKKWQSVIMKEMTEKDKKWHKENQEYVLKLMWHPNIN